jgi:hypothetical protein
MLCSTNLSIKVKSHLLNNQILWLTATLTCILKRFNVICRRYAGHRSQQNEKNKTNNQLDGNQAYDYDDYEENVECEVEDFIVQSNVNINQS